MKRMFLFATSILIFFGLLVSNVTASTITNSTIDTLKTESIVSGSFYKLINPHSGKVLDVSNGNQANGTNVQIWTDNNSDAQKWSITQNSDGTYKLINISNNTALDIDHSGTANKTNVQTWKDNNTAAQKWNIVINSDGTYKLINPNSGKALDVSSSKVANGTNVAIWSDNNTAAQKWKLVAISTIKPAPTKTNAEKKADQIISFAKSLMGKVQYIYGVNDPSKLIFDCSSFTKYVFATQGIDLIWGASKQSDQGTPIYNKSDLRKGDLVHFSTSTPGSIGHVGIYIGNGQFIQNTTGSVYGLEISSIYSGWDAERFIVGTRVIPGM